MKFYLAVGILTVGFLSYFFQEPKKLNRVLAIGDIHGDYQALKSILNFTNYSENDLLVQIGDILDRGDDTIALMEFFISKKSSNITQLMGNHEYMNFMKKLNYISQGDINSFGGLHNRKLAFEQEYGRYITELPLVKKVKDVLFVHGGLSLEVAKRFNSLEEINQEASRNLNKTHLLWGREGPIWYRGYALESLCSDLSKVLEKFGCSHMVMGHTIFKEVTSKCQNKAIFIDTGISKAIRGRKSALEILQNAKETVSVKAIYPHKEELL